MPQKTISLSAKEDLKVYMSPQRQALLRAMRISGKPMTAKALADKLEISASSAAHHISKLLELGVVEEDHTETINGIIARFYRLADVIVSIGLQRDDALGGERSAVIQNILLNTLNGMNEGIEWARRNNVPDERLGDFGDVLSGVIHLKPEDARELLRSVKEFLDAHERYKDGTQPWEFALMFYNSEFTK